MIQDVTPPRMAQTTPQAASSILGVVDISPLLPPNPAAGKVIYIEECAPCHGDSGMGDGPRAEKLPSIPPPVGLPAYSRSISPSRWFQVISQGRIDRLMPGYGTSLSDRQRWDIVAYLMTLGTTPEQIARGMNIYRLECQECHGTETTGGYGNSPELIGPELFHRSVDDLISVLSYNRDSMIHAGIDLTDDEKVSIIAFLRARFFSRQTTGEKSVENLPSKNESNPQTITIYGQIVNGSGETMPFRQPVRLVAYDDREPGFNRQTMADSSGHFVFNEIPSKPDQTYIISTQYRGIEYTSDVLRAGQPGELEDALVIVYEPDTDVSQITADRAHVFFEFPRSDILRVVQLYELNNPTNRIITASSSNGIVIDYPLPAGALNLQFQNGTLGQRYLMTRDGVGDTQPIPPGNSTQVLFSYDLPYRGEAFFEVTIPVKTEAVNILLTSEGVTLKSRDLQEIGEKVVQNKSWQLFIASGVNAGSRLRVQMSGKPRVTTPRENEMSNSLAVGVVSLVIVLVLIGTSIFRDMLDKRTLEKEASIAHTETIDRNAILDAIIALDDQYQAGKIPASAYHERRAELKSRLGKVSE